MKSFHGSKQSPMQHDGLVRLAVGTNIKDSRTRWWVT